MISDNSSVNNPAHPVVRLTYHDFSVSSERVAHVGEGEDDGSDYDGSPVKSGRCWRQFNFYFSAKQNGRYIDPDSFTVNGKKTPWAGEPFMTSYHDGYCIQAYLKPTITDTAYGSEYKSLWDDNKCMPEMKAFNGDIHSFCIFFIVTFSLKYVRSRSSRSLAASFYIDSNRYDFCPKYTDLTYEDLKELIKSSDDKVVDTLITLNSRTPQCPPDIEGSRWHRFRNASDDSYLTLWDSQDGYIRYIAENSGNISDALNSQFMLFNRSSQDPNRSLGRASCPGLKDAYSYDDYNMDIASGIPKSPYFPNKAINNAVSAFMDHGSPDDYMLMGAPYSKEPPTGFEFVPIWNLQAFYFQLYWNKKLYSVRRSRYASLFNTTAHPILAERYNRSEQDYFIWRFEDGKD